MPFPYTALRLHRLYPSSLTIPEPKVKVVGHERMRVKATSRAYAVDWVHVWTLRSGKVVGFSEYTDTAPILAALRRD